jgi:hypothetical protein
VQGLGEFTRFGHLKTFGLYYLQDLFYIWNENEGPFWKY